MLAMQRVHQSYLRVLLAVSVFHDAAGLHFRQAEDLRQKRVSTVPRDRLFKHLPVKVHDPSVWLDCSRANAFDVGVFFRERNRDVTFLFCAFPPQNLRRGSIALHRYERAGRESSRALLGWPDCLLMPSPRAAPATNRHPTMCAVPPKKQTNLELPVPIGIGEAES